MKEIVELRVKEKYASLVFGPDEGDRLGWIRRIHIDASDPRCAQIGELQSDMYARFNEFFFLGWRIRREYTPAELEAAELFRVILKRFFEPEGERCGTIYDDAQACPECGAGDVQMGPLFLRPSRIPRQADWSSTIASEEVASARFRDAFAAARLAGATFDEIYSRRGVIHGWLQLKANPGYVEVVEPTKFGVKPFELGSTGAYRCSRSDRPDLNVLSEVHISIARRPADIMASRVFVGARRGVLRPSRIVLVSPAFRRMWLQENFRGLRFEVAYLH